MSYYIDVDEVLRDTGKSLIVKVADTEHSVIAAEDCFDSRQVVIPKSQIEEESEVADVGDCGTLVVTEWLADQRGW